MKKSKDISKFDLDWQVFRVGLKKFDSAREKVNAVLLYFQSHKTRATQERCANYLEGLSMAYKGRVRTIILAHKEALLEEIVPSLDTPAVTNNYSDYSEKQLKALASDLLIRAKKWLSKGYRNTELLSFLKGLLEYLKDEERLEVLNTLVAASYGIPNTHKFFF